MYKAASVENLVVLTSGALLLCNDKCISISQCSIYITYLASEILPLPNVLIQIPSMSKSNVINVIHLVKEEKS